MNLLFGCRTGIAPASADSQSAPVTRRVTTRCITIPAQRTRQSPHVKRRASQESPRPESNRNTPRTRRCSTIEKHGHDRTLVSACGELVREGASSSGTVLGCVCRRELQREESNLREDRLTAGCLTSRLRWNERLARKERDEPRCAKFSESMAARGGPTRGLVPGAGVEPAFLVSETSVLPARRSRRVRARCGENDVESRAACTRHTSPGRSGGNRTLTTSIKSRARLPVTLRTRGGRAGMPRARGNR
jgi:hypothetical protein